MLNNIDKHVIDNESQTHLCSLVFINTLEKKGSFQCINRWAESRVRRNAEKDVSAVDNALPVHAVVHEDCLPASVLGQDSA